MVLESASGIPILLIYDIDPTWTSREREDAHRDCRRLGFAMRRHGHSVSFLPVCDPDLSAALSEYDPQDVLVFNWCESIPGSTRSEVTVAETLEKLCFTYTGASSDALELSYEKARVKEILESHGVPTPRWKVFGSPRERGWSYFPAIVKPAREHCSYGVDPGAVVTGASDRDDARYAAALGKLVANLRQPNPKFGALHAVPTLPRHFLIRPGLMRRVRDALLVDLQKPQVITSADAKVGVQGMGGIGKSVLAAALARNREVRQSYPDGVVWVACGQHLTNDDLLGRLRDLAGFLGGDTALASLPQAQSVLRELLQAKAVLLVLDDAWHASDAHAFDFLGPRCRMLVTTRHAGILHALNGEQIPVALFTADEALQLLADAVGAGRAALPPEAGEVVRECGCLPLAVALCGGMAKERNGDFRHVLERLRRADLDKIADRESINEQHRSIWRAMQASVEMLADDKQKRFTELAVFDTDGSVPEAAAAVLWAHTGNLDALDTEDLLINLCERSLVQLDTSADADGQRRFRLHDLLYDYAIRAAGDRATLHRNLLDAYRDRCPEGWHSGPNDGYFFENLCHHLIALEAWDDLIGDGQIPGPLSDLLFIQAKCKAGLVHDLVRDYNAAVAALPEFREESQRDRRHDAAMIAYHEALRHYAELRCDWWFARERGQPRPEPSAPGLPAELAATADHAIPEETSPRAARVRHFGNFVSGSLALLSQPGQSALALAYNWADSGPVSAQAGNRLESITNPWLRRSPRPPVPPLRPQCLRTLEGDGHPVRSVSVSPDGRRAVSGSEDKTLRVWDLETGACLRTLEGHSDAVSSVSVSPDGRRAVSGSLDNTLRVWDLAAGMITPHAAVSTAASCLIRLSRLWRSRWKALR